MRERPERRTIGLGLLDMTRVCAGLSSDDNNATKYWGVRERAMCPTLRPSDRVDEESQAAAGRELRRLDSKLAGFDGLCWHFWHCHGVQGI